jgi:hypothetical protein
MPEMPEIPEVKESEVYKRCMRKILSIGYYESKMQTPRNMPIMVYITEYDLLSFNQHQDKFRSTLASIRLGGQDDTHRVFTEIRIKTSPSRMLYYYKWLLNRNEEHTVSDGFDVSNKLLKFLQYVYCKHTRECCFNYYNLNELRRAFISDDIRILRNAVNDPDLKRCLYTSLEYACLGLIDDILKIRIFE